MASVNAPSAEGNSRSTRPACCLATLPFSNAIKVGMPRMPKRAAIAGSSSTLTLAKRARGSSSFAALSKIGAIVAARPTPRRPEVDDQRHIVALDMLVEGLRGQRDRLAGEQVRLAGAALGFGGRAVGRDAVDRGAMGTDDVHGFVMGRALSMALADIRPQSAAGSSGQTPPPRTCDHEFVIAVRGNRACHATYRLQEPKAPTVRLPVRPARPDLIASLEIFG